MSCVPDPKCLSAGPVCALRRGLVLLVPGLLVLAGCQTSPVKLEKSALPLPQAYLNATTEKSVQAAAPDAVASEWWRSFGSRELAQLVDRGLAHNADLRIATLQIAQAKFRSDQTRAGGLPQISAPLRTALQAPGGTVGSVPVTGSSGSTQRSYQASLQGSWRPDIWGEQSALNESADLQLSRAVYARDDAQRVMIGALVNAYANYLAMNDAIALARANEQVAKDILQSIEKRLAAQDATLSEYEQQRAALFVQQAAIPVLEQQREDARHAISQLLGTVPGSLPLSDAGLDELTLPPLEPGLPSSLLLRRPDIRMIEARLLAAHADIQVARARMLPPLDLSAQSGYSALALAQLLQPQSLFWNGIASLAITVFDGGRKEGEKAFAQAYYEEMVATYARTVYQAVREVELALSRVRNAHQRVMAQKGATRAALGVFKVASDAYVAGALDLTALLEARKGYQRQLDDLQRAKSELIQGHVNLAQALGAGGAEDSGSLRQAFPNEPFGLVVEDGRHGMATPLQGAWDVTLPGVFHQSSVLPLWRDLQTRFQHLVEGRRLRAVQLGNVHDSLHLDTAWFQLSVQGFLDKHAADRFCAQLAAQSMGCEASSPTDSQGKIAVKM